MTKITNAIQAREAVSRQVYGDSRLTHVYEIAGTFYFMEVRDGGTRILWRVGARGAVSRVFTFREDIWKALVDA